MQQRSGIPSSDRWSTLTRRQCVGPGIDHGEQWNWRTARPEPSDSTLILSMSKDERASFGTGVSKDEPLDDLCWFDKLTTSGEGVKPTAIQDQLHPAYRSSAVGP